MQIDKHSDTWLAVVGWAKQQRAEAINALIADQDSEQQRGRIDLIDQLLCLTETEDDPVIVSDSYT
jgi:hypothetical protein